MDRVGVPYTGAILVLHGACAEHAREVRQSKSDAGA